jgi:hypothetical protein
VEAWRSFEPLPTQPGAGGWCVRGRRTEAVEVGELSSWEGTTGGSGSGDRRVAAAVLILAHHQSGHTILQLMTL